MFKPDSSLPAIFLRNVEVQYVTDRPLILSIASLTICQGTRVALIGPSGAGKTTLLRLLNGYVQPTAGAIQILGQNMIGRDKEEARKRETRRQVGFIFQDFSLIGRATVFQNVLWGRLGHVHSWRSLFGWFPKADKQAAMAAIAEVDLVAQANRRVDTLSGGQQQRVGVARVVAQEAEILLADEPVSSLDPTLAEEVMAMLARVSRAHKATLIMSLHQPDLAGHYADRIIGLRNGRVVYDQPATNLDEMAIAMIYEREKSNYE